MVGRGNGGGGGGSKDTPWKGLMLATWPSDRLTKIWSGELPATPPQPQQQQATGKRSKQAVSFWRAKPPPGSGWFSLGDFCAVETAAAGASGRVKVPLDVKLPCISRNGRRFVCFAGLFLLPSFLFSCAYNSLILLVIPVSSPSFVLLKHLWYGYEREREGEGGDRGSREREKQLMSFKLFWQVL
ncbi:hypothetical protein QOT17_016522 [Balamuthia mandrillaris]